MGYFKGSIIPKPDPNYHQMRFGIERRAEILRVLSTQGGITVNTRGGIARKDPDLRKLERQGKIKFVRAEVGSLCSSMQQPEYEWIPSLPKRWTFAVLAGKQPPYDAMGGRMK